MGRFWRIAQKEFRQIFPRTGWVEHDPGEIWAVAARGRRRGAGAVGGRRGGQWPPSASRTSAKPPSSGIARTGKPIHNAIVWQDRRTAEFCDQLKQAGHLEMVQQKTGLVIDAYFSASKLRWLLDNVPGARARAERGELAFGTIDSWLALEPDRRRRFTSPTLPTPRARCSTTSTPVSGMTNCCD